MKPRFFSAACLAFFLSLAALLTSANAQPYYLFVGGGEEPTAFDDDPKNWTPMAHRTLGVPIEISPGSHRYRYSLGIMNSVDLKITDPLTTFTESFAIINGRLTLEKGAVLNFLNTGKDVEKNIGNTLQGQAMLTVKQGAVLTTNGSLYMDKFNNADPVPWLVIEGGKVQLLAPSTILAGEIVLGASGHFETPAFNFGTRHNTGIINFKSGSKATIKIPAMTFEGQKATYESLVKIGRIMIDGEHARWRKFKQDGDTLSLAE